MKQNKGIFIVLFAIVVGWYLSSQSKLPTVQNTISSPTPTLTLIKDAPNKVKASLDVLTALSYYYISGEDTNTHQDQDAVTQAITTMLKQNEYLKYGNSSVQGYVNDPNEIIGLTAKGMTLGANQVIKANDDFIAYMRKIDYYDPNYQENLSYAVAKHNTDRDSGFKTIFISAPQISSLYYDYPKTENPTGQIPYLLSKKERETIINQIDRLFSEQLKQYPKGYDASTNTYDTVLVAVYSIQKNIIANTYEEAALLK